MADRITLSPEMLVEWLIVGYLEGASQSMPWDFPVPRDDEGWNAQAREWAERFVGTLKGLKTANAPYMGDPKPIGVWDRNGDLLSPKRSQTLVNHSPDGFAWGYGGSGPAQLALALLLDRTNDPALALAHYQEFKWEVVAKWPSDEKWTLSVAEIDEWLAKR